MTSYADLASDYFDARLDYYTTDDVKHLDRAEQVVAQAARLDVYLDEIALDEDARIAANGGKPLTTS